MKINLGFSNKRYTRDMSFDNNTTYGFGECQPNLCQFMLPDSDISVSAKQLVRLAPLIVPSFARVALNTYARFVPIAELYAPFECLLSGLPYKPSTSLGGFVPSAVPSVFTSTLLLALLHYADITVYGVSSGGSISDDNIILSGWSSTQFSTDFGTELLGFTPTALASISSLNFLQNKTYRVGADNADIILYFQNATLKKKYSCACIRLNNKGCILRKIFVGLGYDVCSQYSRHYLSVSLLPLFAYYKAYYDTFSTNRELGWSSTNCYRLIDFLSENNIVTTSASGFSTISTLLFDFFDDLANTYYADSVDYVSMHTSKPLNTPATSIFTYGNVKPSMPNIGANSISSKIGTLPTFDVANANQLDTILLKGITTFSKYLAKDSVIGKRVNDWVRLHFNADVANQLFKETNFVHRSSMPLQISDVFSTSDTADMNAQTGEHLGAYAGKGIGYGNLKFKYHSTVHGYLIVFSCIAPTSRTFQGVDPSLLALDRFSLPQQEFDALGYEITDKRCIFGSNDIVAVDTDNSDSFGFVPRYTAFKYKKNIVNGDMSRRSMMSTLMPYYLDRYIVRNYVDSSGMLQINSLPTASEEWRYPCKYPWLSNFNRLFINDIDYSKLPEGSREFKYQVDNFISQSIFNVSLKDCLKPIKSSYDTFDDDNDTDVKPVESV